MVRTFCCASAFVTKSSLSRPPNEESVLFFNASSWAIASSNLSNCSKLVILTDAFCGSVKLAFIVSASSGCLNALLARLFMES